jgi:hypothetical protein
MTTNYYNSTNLACQVILSAQKLKGTVALPAMLSQVATGTNAYCAVPFYHHV